MRFRVLIWKKTRFNHYLSLIKKVKEKENVEKLFIFKKTTVKGVEVFKKKEKNEKC